jgi:hypothetical protein
MSNIEAGQMSLKEKMTILVSMLGELKQYTDGDEEVMIIGTVEGSEDEFYPEMYQLINNYDGTFSFDYYRKGHAVHTHLLLPKEEISSAFGKYVPEETKISHLELIWGPNSLIEFTIAND